MSDSRALTPPALEHRLADASALVQVITQINRSLDLPNVLQASLQGIRRFVGGEFGCFLLLEDNASALQLKNADGLSESLLAQLQKITLPHGSEQGVPPEDPAEILSEIGRQVTQILQAHEIRSDIILPLTARRHSLGILLVGVGAGKVLAPLSVDLLLSIGEQIGMAIENARLHTALAESEEWHRTFIENSPDGFWETDAEGRVIYANDSACKMLGYARADLLKMRRTDFLLMDRAELEAFMANLQQQGFLTNQHCQVRRQNGEIRTINFTMRLVRNARGEIVGRQSTFRDVTEQFEALEQLRQRTQEQAALNTIAGILNHPLELAQSVDRVCEQIASITGMESVGVYVLDESTRQLTLIAHRGVSPQLFDQGRQLGLDDLAVSTIITEGKTIALDDVSEFPDRTSFAGPRAEGYHAGIGVPILRRGAPVGAIYVGSKVKTRYDQSDVDLLQNIANQIGGALENADLYAQMQRHIEEVEALAHLSTACAASLDPESLAQTIVKETIQLMRADTCTVRMVENEQVRYLAGVLHAGIDNPSPQLPFEPNTSSLVYDFQPHMIADLQTEVQSSPALRAHLTQLGLRAVLVVPMIARNRTIGILSLGYRVPHQWQPREVDLLQTVANQTANAIDNARLFQSVLTEQRKIQAIFDSGLSGLFATDAAGRIVMFNRAAERITGWALAEVAGKNWAEVLSDRAAGNPIESLTERALLHKETTYAFDGRMMQTKDGRVIPVAKATAPLLDEKDNVIGAVGAFWDLSKEKRAEIEYENFLAMIAHQLRSPLSSVLSALELFERRSLSEARRAELWAIIKAEGNQLRRLADQFLEHETALKSARPVNLEALSVARVARQLIRQSRTRRDRHPFQVRVSQPEPWAYADPQGIENVLRNLLDNAMIYSPPDTPIHIRIKATDADWVTVSVQDFGIGIPLTEQPNLFKPFYRVPQTSERRVYGHGLGLPLAKEMVNAMGGKIWVESDAGQGATFYFTLRRAR